MPEICRFFGIVIRMFIDEHAPPHFHAVYGEHEAQIGISPLSVLRGKLPPRVLALVMEWAAIHQNELLADWELAANQSPLHPIEPPAGVLCGDHGRARFENCFIVSFSSLINRIGRRIRAILQSRAKLALRPRRHACVRRSPHWIEVNHVEFQRCQRD